MSDFLKVKSTIQQRKSLIDRLKEIVDDSSQNLEYFATEKDYIVQEFKKSDIKYNELLDELKQL